MLLLKIFAVNQERRLVEKGAEFFEGATFRLVHAAWFAGATFYTLLFDRCDFFTVAEKNNSWSASPHFRHWPAGEGL